VARVAHKLHLQEAFELSAIQGLPTGYGIQPEAAVSHVIIASAS